MVSPLGNNMDTSWNNIIKGQTGAQTIDSFDTSKHGTKFACTIKGFDAVGYLDAKEAKKLDPFIQYGMIAGIQAMEDAGLVVQEHEQNRAGAIIGSGIGGLGSIEQTALIQRDKGPRRVSPFFVPGSIINMVAGNLSIRFGLRATNLSITTACASATHSIGLAARTIQYNDADIMLAGGAEGAITPLGLAGFGASRALSTRNENPEAASRPWDVDRDGFVLGDGAGILVLEELERAKSRGAKIYGELVGFGSSSDAYHMTSPPENGDGAYLSMEVALKDAGINAEDIDYINAHGTSTPLGDLAELRAIKRLVKNNSQLAVSSTKSMTGHLLGAAGAIEAIFCLLAQNHKVVPPTINLDNPEPEVDLNLVPHQAQQKSMDVVMSNSFGFGGTNGTLVFRRYR